MDGDGTPLGVTKFKTTAKKVSCKICGVPSVCELACCQKPELLAHYDTGNRGRWSFICMCKHTTLEQIELLVPEFLGLVHIESGTG